MLSRSTASIGAAARSAFLAEGANFFASADFLVSTHRDVLDYGIHDTKATLAFLNYVAIRGYHEKDIMPFSLLFNLVCKTALPHFLQLFDLAASGRDDAFNLPVDLVNLFFRGVRIDNEHDFVISHLIFLLCFANAATGRVP